MRSFFISILFISSLTLNAQPAFFETAWGNGGGDFSRSLKQLSDGSIFVMGFSDSGAWGGVDVTLTRLDRYGNIRWTKYYGDTLNNFGGYLNLTSDGQLVICGETQSPANLLDAFLMKLDTSGNVTWYRTYSTNVNESFRHVEETQDGGFIMTGFQNDFSGSNDTYIVKTNPAGMVQWERNFGGTDNDYGFLTHQLPNGTFITSSDTRSSGNGGYDVELIHLDQQPATIWDFTYGNAWQNGCQGLLITGSGKFLSYGETEVGSFSPFDGFMELIDTSGVSEWRYTFGGNVSDAAFSTVENGDGTFTFTGYSNSFNNGNPLDLWVTRVDTSGNMLWTRNYGGNGIDIGYEIIKSLDNGYLICGHRSDSTNTQFYLLHLDQAGLLTGFEKDETSEIKVFAGPNPFHKEFLLSCPLFDGVERFPVIIRDILGRDITSNYYIDYEANTFKIGSANTTEGLIFISVIFKNGVKTLKLIGD